MRRADDEHVEKVMDLLELWLQQQCAVSVQGERKYPDRLERSEKACDSILTTAPVPTAVELTYIESFPGQREDDARFMKVLGAIEPEVEGRLDGSLGITIPIRSIKTGRSWDKARAELTKKILEEHRQLPFSRRVIWIVDGLEFRVMRMRKEGGGGRLMAMRSIDVDMKVEQDKVIADALSKKRIKLVREKEAGLKTMLVLEVDDFVLQSVHGLHAAFRRVTKDRPVPGVDDVILVRTAFSPWCVKPLQLGGMVLQESRNAWPTDPVYPSLDTAPI